MNLYDQLKADAQALREEAAAKIAQAETLERHAETSVGGWLKREFSELKADLEAIPEEVRVWILAHTDA